MSNFPSGTVTFLFTDIEGSTRLAQHHRDQWEMLRERHHAILRSAIETYHGYVFQIIGDAFCVAFHTAGDALRAAAKSQTDLFSESWGAASLKVRMGIHTGKAEIQEDGEYHGYLAMSRIQRLMSAGHGGQVLISAATQELLLEDLPEDVSLRDLGERRLKDLIRAEHIYQLVSANLPVDFPPLKTLDAYRHNLPVQMTSFIGREKEMEEIKQSIITHRLVTLTGVGGTGKTRLCLQVAADMLDQFPGGVWFVELASITDPRLIPQTILLALGIPEQPGMTVLQLLLDYLRGKKLLLILDNCEHLIDACAKLIDTLLTSSPALKILATTREALGLTGELIWHVPSLSLPDVNQLPTIEQFSQYEAVRLFFERAMLVQPHFMVTNDNAPAIAQICFRLDGIPLAIELAAARVRALIVDQIATRLDDRFRLLTGGSRTVLERHQTLRATIDWSYNLLSGNEKLLLSGFSVFAGGWTLEAAEQVCAREETGLDVFDLLTRLVDKSLVILDGSRYHMLETTRQYAREKLLDSEEGGMLRDRHLAYFLELAEQADQEIHGPAQVAWMDRLDTELDNFRAALNWGLSSECTEKLLQLFAALGWTWLVRWSPSESRIWLDKIRALPDFTDYPAIYARVLNTTVHQEWIGGNLGEARSLVEESQAIWLKLGTDGERGLAEALYLSGMIMLNKGNYDEAASYFEQSFELYQKCDDQWGMAFARFFLGHVASDRDEDTLALIWLRQSLDLFRALGDRWGMARSAQRLGELFLKQGSYEKAQPYFDQHLRLDEGLHFKQGTAVALLNLGNLYRYQRDYDQAEQYYEKSLALSREYSLKTNISNVIYSLGMLALHRNQYPMAVRHFTDYFNIARGSFEKISACDFLTGFAAISTGMNQPERAAKLYGAAQALFETTDYRIPPFDRAEFDRRIQMARDQLGEAAFEALAAEGRAMTLEQAIAYALEDSDG
ncbi:MAG: tetratricopeptide repeat protein [Anaerolineales bacterium]